MKSRLVNPVSAKARLVTLFGQAALTRSSRNRFELRGGTKSDEIAAREWISLFLHEAVPKILPK